MLGMLMLFVPGYNVWRVFENKASLLSQILFRTLVVLICQRFEVRVKNRALESYIYDKFAHCGSFLYA